jgi:hypothetical protein
MGSEHAAEINARLPRRAIELRDPRAIEADFDRCYVAADAEPHRLNAQRETQEGGEEDELVHGSASYEHIAEHVTVQGFPF